MLRRPRLLAWLVLVAAVLLTGLVVSAKGSPPVTEGSSAVPSDAESAQVAAAEATLPSGADVPALVVLSRDGDRLGAADRQAVRRLANDLRPLAVGRQVLGPETSPDGEATVLTVPLEGSVGTVPDAVDDVRSRIEAAGLPGGLVGQVTGPAGFEADLSAVFDGADRRLLLATVVVVAVLLLITYRSPLLWLVPLAVIGAADQTALALLTILGREFGLDVADPAITGITSVLVFGAGTNYALLLVARYREELRREDDRVAAMRAAWRSAGPAIVASASTVVLSLLTLLAAVLPFDRAVGQGGATGIAVALVFALLVLPAALVLCGRWLFWPFVPRVGSDDPARSGVWARIGRSVAARPALLLTAGTLVLGALATGLTTASYGLQQVDQFRTDAESVDGQETLARHFTAGASEPLTVTTTVADVDLTVRAAGDVAGVASARPGESAGTAPGDLATVAVVLEAGPGSSASDEAIRDLRTALDPVSEDALVGGSVAQELDTSDAARRDLLVVVPLVLAVVAVVLGVLLRSVVAAVLLILTVVASYFASLGASSFAFTRLLDYPALDAQVPLLAFLFLVALGVDYNIFLTSRAREEATREGTRQGMLTALAVTGGVITSAGILLAAVFTVLGVLPLVLLGQIGVIVGLGVVLDTLLVRTVLVPALVELTGPRFWWPSRPDPRMQPLPGADAS